MSFQSIKKKCKNCSEFNKLSKVHGTSGKKSAVKKANISLRK